MREDRPVPLCWRTPFQRQQSGKRHTLDRHSRYGSCHSKFSGIIRVSSLICFIIRSLEITPRILMRSLFINKSCLFVRFISHTKYDSSSVASQSLVETRSYQYEDVAYMDLGTFINFVIVVIFITATVVELFTLFSFWKTRLKALCYYYLKFLFFKGRSIAIYLSSITLELSLRFEYFVSITMEYFAI